MAGSFREWLARTFGSDRYAAVASPEADVGARIQEIMDNAQREHQDLVSGASKVIGRGRNLELLLSRQRADAEKLQGMLMQAGVLADRAEQSGDSEEAAKYRETSTSLGAQLLGAQRALESSRARLNTANANSADARRRVEISATRLNKLLEDRAGFQAQFDASTVAFSMTAVERRQAAELAARQGTSTGSRTELQGRYRAVLRAADALPESVNGRITTARIEAIREAAKEERRLGATRLGPSDGSSGGSTDHPSAGHGG
jgi:phage shock protein A